MGKYYRLPSLPFQAKELARVMSSDTLHFHHKKHHQTYIDKVNELLDEASHQSLQNVTVQALVERSEGELFNHASQMWAHTFLWYSLCAPEKSKSARSLIDEAVKNSLGSWKESKEQFIELGSSHFGSGWLWLVKKSIQDDTLEWITLHDAESPLSEKKVPLLACDLWEHGYYLDFQNDRKSYLKALFPHLNWSFAAMTLARGTVPQLDWALKLGKHIKQSTVEYESLKLIA